MFDVSWTDPGQETVGQRKNRKDQHSNGISRGSSVRSTNSSESRASKASKGSDSTPISSRPSLFNLFTGNKKTPLNRSGSQSRLSALANEKNVKVSRRISSYTAPAEPKSPRTTTMTQINTNEDGYERDSCNIDTDVSSPSDASVFSGWTGRSNNTESSWSSVADPSSAKSSIVQPLSRTSFVTQSTEVTISPRDSVHASEQLATIVHISASGTMPIQIKDCPSRVPSASETFEFPLPKSQLPEKGSTAVLRDDITISVEGWPVPNKGRQPDTWRPPDAWECPSDDAVQLKPSKSISEASVRTTRSRKALNSSSKLSNLQKSLRKMEAASPKIVVQHLKGECIEIADASVYRELELEKQLWMLSALRTLEKKRCGSKSAVNLVDEPSQPIKILSLYENHASASFVASYSPSHSAIHHLSPNPLSPASYPNVHPLTTPSPTPSLPYASNLFMAIHSLYLPALLPGSSLPIILKDCHRCLSNGGTLHLTILDPSPLPGTLGPKLREWLDTHLLINLERQFRCINPSRLFPIWLADADLRGEGSTISIQRFLASVSAVAISSDPRNSEEIAIADGDEQEQEITTKRELKSQVGRMLWRELWGGFVEGEKWWWEDEMIVEECEKLGTGWEYAVITAVKEV